MTSNYYVPVLVPVLVLVLVPIPFLFAIPFPFPDGIAARPVAHDRLSDHRKTTKKRSISRAFVVVVAHAYSLALSLSLSLPLSITLGSESLLSHSEMRKRLSLIVYRSFIARVSSLGGFQQQLDHQLRFLLMLLLFFSVICKRFALLYV